MDQVVADLVDIPMVPAVQVVQAVPADDVVVPVAFPMDQAGAFFLGDDVVVARVVLVEDPMDQADPADDVVVPAAFPMGQAGAFFLGDDVVVVRVVLVEDPMGQAVPVVPADDVVALAAFPMGQVVVLVEEFLTEGGIRKAALAVMDPKNFVEVVVLAVVVEELLAEEGIRKAALAVMDPKSFVKVVAAAPLEGTLAVVDQMVLAAGSSSRQESNGGTGRSRVSGRSWGSRSTRH